MPDPAPHVSTQQEMFGAILAVTGWRIPAVPAGRVGKWEQPVAVMVPAASKWAGVMEWSEGANSGD